MVEHCPCSPLVVLLLPRSPFCPLPLTSGRPCQPCPCQSPSYQSRPNRVCISSRQFPQQYCMSRVISSFGLDRRLTVLPMTQPRTSTDIVLRAKQHDPSIINYPSFDS